MQRATFVKTEDCSGDGELIRGNVVLRRVRYSVRRYQGMLEGSGMPVPGLHRVEGAIEDGAIDAALIAVPLTLRLEDGRAFAITIADGTGRILAEGHGPSRCSCC